MKKEFLAWFRCKFQGICNIEDRDNYFLFRRKINSFIRFVSFILFFLLIGQFIISSLTYNKLLNYTIIIVDKNQEYERFIDYLQEYYKIQPKYIDKMNVDLWLNAIDTDLWKEEFLNNGNSKIDQEVIKNIRTDLKENKTRHGVDIPSLDELREKIEKKTEE